MGEIRTAIEREDFLGVERTAHCWKGCVADFFAGRAVSAAVKLERSGAHGNLAESRGLFRVLEHELETLGPELSSPGGDKP